MTDETKPEAPPAWEKKSGFGATRELRKIVEGTIEATKLELEHLRKKLEKATYGG
jgi:hypothetical protein